MGNELLYGKASDGAGLAVAAGAAQGARSSLFEDFIAAHKDSLARDVKDNQNCQDAMDADKASIKLHKKHKHGGHTKLMTSAQTDMTGDYQAMGQNGQPGDDQKNAAADQRVIDIDKQMLASGNLTDEQKALINQDMDSKQRNITNCNNDIPNEAQYIQHDQAEIQALTTGQGIKEASAAVVADRNQDLNLEPTYIQQNKNDAALNQRILDVFSVK